VPGEVLFTICVPSDLQSTECVPGDVQSTECVPSDVQSTNCVPCDVQSTECVPGDVLSKSVCLMTCSPQSLYFVMCCIPTISQSRLIPISFRLITHAAEVYM